MNPSNDGAVPSVVTGNPVLGSNVGPPGSSPLNLGPLAVPLDRNSTSVSDSTTLGTPAVWSLSPPQSDLRGFPDGAAPASAILYPPATSRMVANDRMLFGQIPAPTCPMLYAEHAQNGRRVAVEALPFEYLDLVVENHIVTSFVTVKAAWRYGAHIGAGQEGYLGNTLLAVPFQKATLTDVFVEDQDADSCYTTAIISTAEAAELNVMQKPARNGSGAVNSSSGASPTGDGDGATGSPEQLEQQAELASLLPHSPELFKMIIPDCKPGGLLTVTISWFQPLEFTRGWYASRVALAIPRNCYPPDRVAVSQFVTVRAVITTPLDEPVTYLGDSHPMKVMSSLHGRIELIVDNGVEWKNQDFVIAHAVWSEGIVGAANFERAMAASGMDSRDSLCISLAPPSPNHATTFPRSVIFLVDRSGSMDGAPMQYANEALVTALRSLTPRDVFNIIAFDHEQAAFSGRMAEASAANVDTATQWVAETCVARGLTDILTPMEQAMAMLQDPEAPTPQGSVPYIFLITDGAVENERHICHVVMQRLAANQGWTQSPYGTAPRISTFGIGQRCNYYFLKILAEKGRGLSDVAFTNDRLRMQMDGLLLAAATPVVTDITVKGLPHDAELYPSPPPDLFVGAPVVIAGKYRGVLPPTLAVEGRMPGGGVWRSEVFLKQQMDLLTAKCWLEGSDSLREKVEELSIRESIPSEYTLMVSFKTTKEKKEEMSRARRMSGKNVKLASAILGGAGAVLLVSGLMVGFGSVGDSAVAVGGAAVTVGEAVGSAAVQGGDSGGGGDDNCCDDCGDGCKDCDGLGEGCGDCIAAGCF
eukprot:jgi/Mesvir1/613/Mv02046-RA.2